MSDEQGSGDDSGQQRSARRRQWILPDPRAMSDWHEVSAEIEALYPSRLRKLLWTLRERARAIVPALRQSK